MTLEKLITYFHSSRFDYLALDFAGVSLRLARHQARCAEHALARDVTAPSVGFIEAAVGRDHFPRDGMIVAEGEPLFTLRRFKDTIEVKAPIAGTVAAVSMTHGTFVEYGQRVAVLKVHNR